MTQWIIFDAMGVVFEIGDDTNELLVPFIQKMNPAISTEIIQKYYLMASLGEITSKQFWLKIGLESMYSENNIEKEYLESCITLDSQFISVASELKNKYKIGILSNDLSEWFSYLRNLYKIDELLDIAVISGDVGYRKPDLKIYEIFLEKTGARPEECIFIDDREKNLKPAMDLGMKVIKFNREKEEKTFLDIISIESFDELGKAVY